MYSLAIDLLHSWHLGPLQRFIAFCLVFILKSKVWATDVPHLSAGEHKQLGMLRLRAELWIYYRMVKRQDPSWADSYSEVLIHMYIYMDKYKNLYKGVYANFQDRT